MRNGQFTTGIVLCAALLLAAIAFACSQPADDAGQSTSAFDLDQPVPEKPTEVGMDIVGKKPEEIWQIRCGQCHSNEQGLDRFTGDDWEPIIKRMMKKPGALLNTSIARIIYLYLWERTTGEQHPDREELLNAPINTAGMGGSVGGEE